MKRILLTTTALTMTAGIAAAEVTVTGDLTLGFNDTGTVGTAATADSYALNAATGVIDKTAGVAASADYKAGPTGDNNYGLYNNAGITFAMSGTLDNGMVTGVTVDMDGSAAGVNDTASNAVGKYKLSVANDSTAIEFGSAEYSARSHWVAAGDMATDGWFNQNDDGLNVLKADTSVGGLKISVSANTVNGSSNAAPNPVSLAIAGSLGGASYVIANEGSMMGISATTAAGGATVTTAYSSAPSKTSAVGVAPVTYHASQTDTSTGVKIAYPMGSVVATASYVMESKGAASTSTAKDSWNISAVWTSGGTTVTFATDENSDNSVEGSTTLGGATVSAGLDDYLGDMYLAVSNPIGTGATLVASYALEGTGADNTDAKDEIGAGDWQEGLTVELKFAF
ncbi:porin [Planktomarina sp.]|nr:porin [Planktomarina sp.]